MDQRHHSGEEAHPGDDVRNWRQEFPDCTLEEAARRVQGMFASSIVRRYAYPPHTRFCGWTRRAVVFVVAGSVEYTFKEALTLREGDYEELPGGDYWFASLGDAPVDLVLVIDSAVPDSQA